MKAVVKAEQRRGIQVMDVPVPKIKPNEALVQIKACGICGGDLKLYEGGPGAFTRIGRKIELPRIIGHEPSGVVVEVGPEVRTVKVGDRVASNNSEGCGFCHNCQLGYFNVCVNRTNIGSFRDGAMAEYCAIPQLHLYKIPDSISYEEAAVLEPLGVAVRAFETLVRFKAGDDVAVLGPGPIGLLAALVARASGAGKVFVTGRSSSEKRLELARSLGFTTINVEKENVRDVVFAATEGLGVDVVIDSTSKGTPPEALTLLKGVGQLVISASLEGQVSFDAYELKSRSVIITLNRSTNPSTWFRAINLVASGQVDVKPVVTHKVRIEDADQAFQALCRREAVKALILP